MPTLQAASKAPALRLQPQTKNFFVRIPKRAGGGTRFFGSDRSLANARYLAWASEYAHAIAAIPDGRTRRTPTANAVAANRESMANLKLPPIFERWGQNTPGIDVEDPQDVPSPRPLSGGKTVQAVAQSLYAVVDAESGEHGRLKVRDCLAPFLAFKPEGEIEFGKRPIQSLKPDPDFVKFKAWLATSLTVRGKPRSSNTQRDVLTYVRRLFTHAFDVEALKETPRLKVLKNPGRDALLEKGWTVENLKTLLSAVASLNPNLARMAYVSFAACLRPFELPRLMYGQYEEKGKGLLACVSKTSKKTQSLRVCCLSDPCLSVFKQIVPAYKSGYGIRHELWKVGRRLRAKHGDDFILKLTGSKDLGAHKLRHTSVRTMIQAGVTLENRRLLMGRLPERVDKTYGVDQNYEAARNAAAVLCEIVPPSVLDVERVKGRGIKKAK